jgi:hypothetical protein
MRREGGFIFLAEGSSRKSFRPVGDAVEQVVFTDRDHNINIGKTYIE